MEPAIEGPDDPPPRVVLSYGLGVDSTAILLRYLEDPASRDFALHELLVITAMTGDEWQRTGHLVTQHVLPRLAARNVRYVQVARASSSQTDGIVVLDDSRAPTRLYLDGVYRLSQEMRAAGTVPQCGGSRLCSAKSKGWPLDQFIAQATRGQPYRHIIGFEAEETRRATKDAGYNNDVRTGEYPLITQGWDRQTCIDYIAQVTGVTDWNKSACVYCPFALTNKAGLQRTLAAYDTVPDAGADALLMEHLAVALNPAQGLIAGKRLIDVIQVRGGSPALTRFYERLDHTEHSLYRVRRLLHPRKDDPSRMANASRETRVLDVGTRQEMLAELLTLAQDGGELDEYDGIPRLWTRRRSNTLPSGEAFYVVAPSGADEKSKPRFQEWWDALLQQEPQLLLA